MEKIKDLLTTMIGINTDTNINVYEKAVLNCLIQYHNIDLGYSYPQYEQIKLALSTKRNETVSNNLKSLIEKGYIRKEKVGRNKNIYYVLKHLHIIEKDIKSTPAPVEVTPAPAKVVETIENQQVIESNDKIVCKNTETKKDPVDSTGHKPMDGQVHIADLGVDVDAELISSVETMTGFNKPQSIELLNASSNNLTLISQAVEYTNRMTGVVNKFNYVLKMVREFKNKPQPATKDLAFNNFEPRQYDYEALEKKLLGWDDEDDAGTYCTYNPVIENLF